MLNGVSHREKMCAMTVLDVEALQAVSGGWCGTPYPIHWGHLPPPPEPDPWFRAFDDKISLVSLNPQPLPPSQLTDMNVAFVR